MSEHVHAYIGSRIPSADKALRFVGHEAAGGIAIFAGTTRSVTDGQETLQLYYEAYEEMALSEIRKLADRARVEWGLEKVFVAHRIGIVPTGEVSVLIAVSAAHRVPAFEACRFLIDAVKSQVPIWKKETFVSGDTTWVEGTIPDLT